MRRIALVALWSVACARPSTTPSTVPPPAMAAAIVDPAADDRVRLRFVDAATLEIVERGATRRATLDVHEPGGAVLLAAGGAATGAMLPLARVIDGTVAQTFAITETPSCRMPWIIDVDADLLVAGLEVRGVPGSLRIGCGPLQHVDLVTVFGPQRVIVYGDAGFDVRMVAAELGIIRTELERIFAVHVARRWLDEVVVEPSGSRPLPRARATTTGLRIAIETDRTWDAAPRLEVGATVARVWLAKTFEVIATAPEPAAAHLHAALVHGLAHGIARESLFALGLLSPSEYVNELDGAEALVAERAAAWRVAGVVDARDVAAAAAAHSIEAARVTWTLRQAGGAASLPEALERASDATDPATTMWARLAATAATTRALGPCIVSRKARGAVVDLGYAVAWDAERGAETITALREGAPAAAAGLRVGDRVLHVDSQHSVVRVLRDAQSLAIDVPARPRTITRRGWMRRAGIADDRCYPST